MIALCTLFLGLLSISPVFQEPAKPVEPKLAWADLIGRPERWPLAAKLSGELRFTGGATLAKGTELRIAEVTAQDVTVITPAGVLYRVGQSDTNLVGAANKYMKSLTPAQKAVTLQTIVSDITIQPPMVHVYVSVEAGDVRLPANREYRLFRFDGNELAVWAETMSIVLDARYTDVLQRARALVALPESQRPGRIPALLAGTTVDAEGKPIELAPVQYYVFYGCTSQCARCAVYTPKFVERYNKTLAQRKDVAVVTLSNHGDVQDALAYAKASGMTWPIVPGELRRHELNAYHVALMPGMALVDRFGRMLAWNGPGFPELEKTDEVLDKLDELLRTREPESQ